MGWYLVDLITVSRDYNTREIVVRWKDAVTGDHEERFPFKDANQAFAFAQKTFDELAM